MKIIRLLLLFFFMGLMPISCNFSCFTDCGCNGGDTYRFTIENFSVTTQNKFGDYLENADTYPFDSIYFMLKVSESSKAALNTGSTRQGLFIATAMACDPVPPYAVQAINKISILAAKDMSIESEGSPITKGDNISHLFLGGVYAESLSPLTGLNIDYIDYSTQILIRLAEKSSQGIDLYLDISVELSDGTVFNFDNQIIRVI